LKGQRLDRTLRCYRIGDPAGEFPVYSSGGSKLYPGRWNDPDTPMIYAGEHYSTAMLEKLVHGNGALPPNQHFIEIEIPNGVSYEMVTKDSLPGWDAADCAAARGFGVRWRSEGRSALLLVPSFVARLERNVLINETHPDASAIHTSLPAPVWWDARLFADQPKSMIHV
jgi:RES domain-containing protein